MSEIYTKASATTKGAVVVKNENSRTRFRALAQAIAAMQRAEQEYYDSHHWRRLLKNLGLIREPDFKARMWALKKIGDEAAAKRLECLFKESH